MLATLIAFLAVINPFALFLYLEPLMDDLDHKAFVYVWIKACLISFLIYIAFSLTGLFIFEEVFRIRFESFRIFGGIIVATLASIYIVRGDKAIITLKEDLDDLASEIALPFIVGAATITLAILIGQEGPASIAILGIFGIMLVTFFAILLLKAFRDRIVQNRLKVAFDKNMQILLRLNAFIVGAIGVDMIVSGISNLFF